MKRKKTKGFQRLNSFYIIRLIGDYIFASRNKPSLISFVANYLLVMTALIIVVMLVSIGFAVYLMLNKFSFITVGLVILLIVFEWLLGWLHIACGLGILKREKWAKTTGTVIFALTLILNCCLLMAGYFKSLFFLDQIQIIFLLCLPGFGLYIMTIDRSVKDYFDRDPTQS